MNDVVTFLEGLVATITIVVAISRSNRTLERRLIERIELSERNLATEIRALAAVTDARFETANYRLGVLEAGTKN